MELDFVTASGELGGKGMSGAGDFLILKWELEFATWSFCPCIFLVSLQLYFLKELVTLMFPISLSVRTLNPQAGISTLLKQLPQNLPYCTSQ